MDPSWGNIWAQLECNSSRNWSMWEKSKESQAEAFKRGREYLQVRNEIFPRIHEKQQFSSVQKAGCH